jgi:hypothetical protein
MPVQFEIHFDKAEFERLEKKLKSFERDHVLGAAVNEVGEKLLDKLRTYPPYRYVSRRAAYGQPFFSDRQRRWFFAALRDGTLKIGDNRTGKLRQGWRMEEVKPTERRLFNEVAYASYVQGERNDQARQPKLVGWLTISEYPKRFKSEMEEAFKDAIRRWL